MKILKNYQVVVFSGYETRKMIRKSYVSELYGSWWCLVGISFAGFALNKSKYEQNWPWYYRSFLRWVNIKTIPDQQPRFWNWKYGSSVFKQYTSYFFTSISNNFPVGKSYTDINFKSYYPSLAFLWDESPNLQKYGIQVVPIAWTNSNYKMVYCNFGHNDMNYEGKTNKTLDRPTFSGMSKIIYFECLLWLGSFHEEILIMTFCQI